MSGKRTTTRNNGTVKYCLQTWSKTELSAAVILASGTEHSTTQHHIQFVISIWGLLNFREENMFIENTLCLKKHPACVVSFNFVKPYPIFKILSLLERIWNLLQQPQIFPNTPQVCCCTTLKSWNLLQIWRKMHTKCVDFDVHLLSVTGLLTYFFSFWFLLNIL